MSKEAMKQALEALTKNSDRVTEIRAKDQAITALREALAKQPAQQEPVAYLHQCGKKPELKELSFKKNEPSLSAKGYKAIPLTTPQPAPVQQEPVGYVRTINGEPTPDNDGTVFSYGINAYQDTYGDEAWLPVIYTSPQPAQRKPLTPEQRSEIYTNAIGFEDGDLQPVNRGDLDNLTDAIEAAHGIKGDT